MSAILNKTIYSVSGIYHLFDVSLPKFNQTIFLKYSPQKYNALPFNEPLT